MKLLNRFPGQRRAAGQSAARVLAEHLRQVLRSQPESGCLIAADIDQRRRKLQQIGIRLRREPFHALPIHTRRAFLGADFRPCQRQRRAETGVRKISRRGKLCRQMARLHRQVRFIPAATAGRIC